VTLDAGVARKIDRAAHAERAVDDEAGGRQIRRLPLGLHHVVGEDDGLAEIVQEIADGGAREVRHDGAVADRHRLDEIPVEVEIEREDVTVHRLERIVRRLEILERGRVGRRRGAGGQRDERSAHREIRDTARCCGQVAGH
jgi:hypothetical protein